MIAWNRSRTVLSALAGVSLIGAPLPMGIVRPAAAQDAVVYQRPPRVIEDLVLAPPTPGVSIDDRGAFALLTERRSLPSIAELARPELRIAGMRLDPGNFGPSRAAYASGYRIKDLRTGREMPVSGLPNPLQGGNAVWNPSQTKIAVTHTTDTQIDLYEIDVATARAKKVNRRPLNLVLGGDARYLNDATLLYGVTVAAASAAPVRSAAPSGPVVQQNLGKVAASRTYQDLIKNPYDAALFAFYGTTQLVKSENGRETPIGSPGLIARVSASPDAKYLLVETIEKPFSYLVPSSGFPSKMAIVDPNGRVVKEIASLPSSEGAPVGFDNVQDVPRAFAWRADEPATLVWAKPLDGGLIRNAAPFRDAVYALPAPFTATAREIAKTTMRFRGITWGDAKLALLNEGLSGKQQVRVNRFDPSTGALTPIIERSTNDAYGDPGTPVLRDNQYHRGVLQTVNGGKALLMTGTGASPKGNLPFLSVFDLEAKKNDIVWRSADGTYESVVKVLDADKRVFVTSRQSPTEPPNYLRRDLSNGDTKPLTTFADPQPALRTLQRRKIQYTRKDGIGLTGTLYLPANYDPARDGRLPVLMWAYPREFRSASDAAQVRGSQFQFTRVSYGSPVFWALRGYAVLDEAEFPVVGEGDKQPNDTFIDQLIANAEAAIDAVDKLGVGDRKRVAIGGHSYGAFMTANLLAHSRLFKAGLARSGAYNRTLTPFGFQNEERTYWDSPEIYFQMSPFSYANQVKDALLLVHGDSDDNPGTFPIQSERLYNAIKGNGGTVRFVSLPFEGHGYAARENILHLLWESDTWLETYVKNAK